MSKDSRKPQRTLQTFWIRAPGAQKVRLAGSFNGWDTEATPMKKNENGVWGVELQLEPGHYEYKFVVDGIWRNQEGCEEDHTGCPHCVPNDSGTRNCVLEVH